MQSGITLGGKDTLKEEVGLLRKLLDDFTHSLYDLLEGMDKLDTRVHSADQMLETIRKHPNKDVGIQNFCFKYALLTSPFAVCGYAVYCRTEFTGGECCDPWFPLKPTTPRPFITAK